MHCHFKIGIIHKNRTFSQPYHIKPENSSVSRPLGSFIPSSQLTTKFSTKYLLTTIYWANSQLISLTWGNSTFRECSSLRICSSVKRFLYSFSKVLGVLQSTTCFVRTEVRNRGQVFHLRSQKFFVPRYTLFLHPQCYLFRRRTLFSPISKAL